MRRLSTWRRLLWSFNPSMFFPLVLSIIVNKIIKETERFWITSFIVTFVMQVLYWKMYTWNLPQSTINSYRIHKGTTFSVFYEQCSWFDDHQGYWYEDFWPACLEGFSSDTIQNLLKHYSFVLKILLLAAFGNLKNLVQTLEKASKIDTYFVRKPNFCKDVVSENYLIEAGFFYS